MTFVQLQMEIFFPCKMHPPQRYGMYNILWETLNDSEKKKNKEKLYVITAGNEDLFKKMTIANQNNISFPVSLQVGRPLRTQAL